MKHKDTEYGWLEPFRRQVHKGWLAYWAKHGMKKPRVSKHHLCFTEEELKRFLAASNGDRDEDVINYETLE